MVLQALWVVLQALWDVVTGVLEGVVLAFIWFWMDGWIFLHVD